MKTVAPPNINPHPRTVAMKFPTGGATAAPRHFPYHEHRTVAEVNQLRSTLSDHFMA